MENLIGKRLDGRYEIIELVGMGGMANVYKANDLTDNRVVAVKVLREEFLDNEELVRRFKNESKAIGLLSHPNIVKVFDVNFSDAVQYIVMEFIDGITLKQYIDVQKPLSWRDTVHFTTQVLRALQHAHDRGIVHRDIKPQNIMLLSDGSIKVMDFGIARFSRSETRTITDKAIGSVHYISPEQAKGDITDAKADIYSVGIMMYEMLTGTLPFESETPVQVAIKQISDDARRPREIVEDIPEGLEEITLKAMAKNPGKRYQSASQMLRDIDDFKKNPSIVFEYKYFTDPSPTKYIDKAETNAAGAPKKTREPGEKKPVKKGDRKRRRSNITMYVVLGVTAAFVISTLILVMFSLGVFDKEHEETVLPNFTGAYYQDLLQDPQYSFRFVESKDSDYNIEYEIGQVYRQVPVSGSTVKDNSKVTLYISKGPEIVELPDVVGMTSGNAIKVLSTLGLQIKTEYTSDSNQESNVVIGMSPEHGTELVTGDVVTLTINFIATVGRTTVPNVMDIDINEAYDQLGLSGLTVMGVEPRSSDRTAGTVLEQSIDPGTTVPFGTGIKLVVSSGAPTQSYDIALAMPAPPGTASSYNVVVTVNGNVVSNQTLTAANSDWRVNVTVETQSTIAVTLNGITYATYTASNTESNLRQTSGGTSFTWPSTPVSITVVQPAGGVAVSAPAPSYGGILTIEVNVSGLQSGYTYNGITVNGVLVTDGSTYTYVMSGCITPVTVSADVSGP